MNQSKMRRVSREHKCPGCHNTTWCLLGDKGYVCMRTQSNQEIKFKGGEIGWFHYYNGERPKLPPPPKPVKVIDAEKMLKGWATPGHRRLMPNLARQLGVSVESLEALECTKAPWRGAWGFPMKDGYGNYVGIRIRSEQGDKWAQPGSHAGLFIPRMAIPRRILVVEGPTDTAAAITLGYFAIGRPSCSGGVEHILKFVRRTHVHEVVIISDNDDDKLDPNRPGHYKPNPGLTGAAALQSLLPVASCAVVLPCKDIREFLRIGDKGYLDSMINSMIWTQPKDSSLPLPPQ